MKPTYFYRIREFMTTFEKAVPCYAYSEDFTDGDLFECRKKAVEYYTSKVKAVEERGHFFKKEFAAYGPDFKIGMNSAYSIQLAFVVDEGNETYEYYLVGEGEEETAMAIEIEREIFQKMLIGGVEPY